MNKYFLVGVFGVLTALIPAASFAFTYNYYKPLGNTNSNILLSWGPFGSLENYTCDMNSYSCAKTDQKKFSVNDNLTVANDQAWYNPNKNLAVYKTTEKTLSEKITRYYISSYDQNQWLSGKQLFITDDVQEIYWPENNRNEFVFAANSDSQGEKDFVRFNFSENKEVTRINVSDNVTNETISPDGLWFAYYVPLDEGTKSTVLLSLLPGSVKEYRVDYSAPKNWELLLDENRLLAFSPNSKRFAFLEDSRGFSVVRLADLTDIQQLSLAVADAIGGNAINTALDIWFPANDTLLIGGNDKKNPLDWYLYSYDIARRDIVSVVSDIAYMYEMKPVGKQILLGKMSGPNLVPILYDPNTKKSRELNLKKSVADSNISKETISFKSGLNGVLIRNKNAKMTSDTPLAVWIHGGPFRQIGKDYHSYPSYAVYDWVLDQLASQGAIILKVDYAGSYGYGNDTAYSVVNNVGKNDIANVYDAFIEAKIKLGFNGKAYLMGNSYGGYLAPRMLAISGDFSGAIAINGVYEWRTLTNYLKSSGFNVHFNGLYDPNDPKLYNQASITAIINKLSPNQKVVIVNGMADATINPDQSYTFYELLKNANKNVKIVSIPEETHIFSKPASIETICKTAAETMGLPATVTYCQFK